MRWMNHRVGIDDSESSCRRYSVVSQTIAAIIILEKHAGGTFNHSEYTIVFDINDFYPDRKNTLADLVFSSKNGPGGSD